MRDKREPVILGFNRKSDNIKYFHCQIHQGARLLPYPGEEGLYLCPECGIPYSPNQVKSDTHITSRFSTIEGQKQIISGKNRSHIDKKFYDQSGHELPKGDPDIMRDVAEGHTVVSYHTTEDLTKDTSKEYSYVKKR